LVVKKSIDIFKSMFYYAAYWFQLSKEIYFYIASKIKELVEISEDKETDYRS